MTKVDDNVYQLAAIPGGWERALREGSERPFHYKAFCLTSALALVAYLASTFAPFKPWVEVAFSLVVFGVIAAVYWFGDKIDMSFHRMVTPVLKGEDVNGLIRDLKALGFTLAPGEFTAMRLHTSSSFRAECIAEASGKVAQGLKDFSRPYGEPVNDLRAYLQKALEQENEERKRQLEGPKLNLLQLNLQRDIRQDVRATEAGERDPYAASKDGKMMYGYSKYHV